MEIEPINSQQNLPTSPISPPPTPLKIVYFLFSLFFSCVEYQSLHLHPGDMPVCVCVCEDVSHTHMK